MPTKLPWGYSFITFCDPSSLIPAEKLEGWSNEREKRKEHIRTAVVRQMFTAPGQALDARLTWQTLPHVPSNTSGQRPAESI